MNDFVVVIPARFASTRLPGKPLRLIAGESMIRRVHRIAMESGAQEVWIATDDARIQEAALGFGAEVCMTAASHQSGTERLAEVADLLAWPDDLVVVNLQGDEPLMPPALIDQCAALLDSASADMATLASALEGLSEMQSPHIVKVITDAHDRALYFSRAPIPHCRDAGPEGTVPKMALRHHGLYAYRRHVLRQLVDAEPCALEECEKLEQLRALWLGIPLRVGRAVVQPGPGVDTEDDLAAVEAIIERIGLE